MMNKINVKIIGVFLLFQSILILSPKESDLTSRDFLLSRSDVLLSNVMQLNLGIREDINDFSISFSQGNANRIGFVNIYYSSDKNIDDNQLLMNFKGDRCFKLVGEEKNKRVYLNSEVELKILYIPEEHMYQLRLRPKESI